MTEPLGGGNRESAVDIARGGAIRAEFRLPSRDLGEDLAFFGESLGLRLESIFPADDPAVAVLSGHGVRLRLERGGGDEAHASPPGTIRFLCERPAAVAGGETELTAPNGTRIELRAAGPRLYRPPTRHALEVRRLGHGDSWVIGRAGMHYRDLIPRRLGGAVIASHIRIPEAGPVPDLVHYHIVAFQLIYCYRGWIEMVYEDQGPPFRLSRGECLIQPPEIRHRVLESSANLEVIELAVPAEHVTEIDHELELPTGRLAPEREFGGQRFRLHRPGDSPWRTWRIPGFEARDTGVAAATGGVADVRVARRADGRADVATSHDADILFTFVLKGTMVLLASGHGASVLHAGDAFAVPPRLRTTYESCSTDLELLEVTLPATFETMIGSGGGGGDV